MNRKTAADTAPQVSIRSVPTLKGVDARGFAHNFRPNNNGIGAIIYSVEAKSASVLAIHTSDGRTVIDCRRGEAHDVALPKNYGAGYYRAGQEASLIEARLIEQHEKDDTRAALKKAA